MAKPDFSVDLGPNAGTGDSPNNVADVTVGPILAGDTAVTVTDGTLFTPVAAGWHVFATLSDGVNIEVVRVSGVAANVLTIVRAVELAAAVGFPFPDGTIIERRVSNGLLQAISPVHPSTGDVEIGRAATAGLRGIAIGPNAIAGVDSVNISSGGALSHVLSDKCVGIGYRNVIEAGSHRVVVLGSDNDVLGAVSDGSVVIGTGNRVNDYNGGTNGIVIGHYNWQDDAGSATQIGDENADHAYSTFTIGYRCFNSKSPYSLILGGYQSKVFHHASLIAPPRVVGRVNVEDFYAGMYSTLLGGSYVHSLPPVDIGQPIPWATATVYRDMQVVEAITPTTTEQWFFAVGVYAENPDTDEVYSGWYNGADVNQVTSTTEPLGFTGGADEDTDSEPNDIGANGGYMQWNCTDIEGVGQDVSVIEGLGGQELYNQCYVFIPTRIGFFAYSTTGAIVTDPVFNFGNENSPTAYLTGQAIDGFAGGETNAMQWFDVGKAAAVEGAQNLRVRLTTAGVGGSIMGKFVVEGYYVAMLG